MTDAAKPWLSITPQLMGKMALSTVLMATGMFYLATGRRDAEMSRIFTGAVLALLSVFVFAF